MTPTPRQQLPRFGLFCLAAIAVTATGCTTMKLPPMPFSSALGVDGASEAARYEGVSGEKFTMEPSIAEQSYHSVRRARAENAIVLQVAGDDTPVRVLPLPPGDKAVYVSDLLKQTGVMQKLDYLEATLYRHSTDSINGIPMIVSMTRDGRSVRPESDYALQPGDRLSVQKTANPALQGLVNTVLGL